MPYAMSQIPLYGGYIPLHQSSLQDLGPEIDKKNTNHRITVQGGGRGDEEKIPGKNWF